jgi:type I restriction enzyme R subunit
LEVDEAIRAGRQDDWRSNTLKIKKVKLAIKSVLEKRRGEAGALSSAAHGVSEESPSYGTNTTQEIDALVEMLVELAKNQNEY